MLLSSQSLSCVPKGAASPLGIERPWCAPLLQHLALSVMYSAFVGDLSLTPEDVSHGWLIFAFLIGFSKNFYDRKNCICTYVCIHTHTHIYIERAFTIIYMYTHTHTHTHTHTYSVRNNDKEENHLYDTCRSRPWSYRPSKVHIISPKFRDSPFCATDLDNAEFLFCNSFFVCNRCLWASVRFEPLHNFFLISFISTQVSSQSS